MSNYISSPDDDGSRPKINSRSPTKYKPLQLCDDSVYDLAQHYYTALEIAERFNITKSTLLLLHSDAFNAGKDNAFNKPRMALKKIIDDFMADDALNGGPLHFANKDVPVERLLKAIELHARKYEGLGKEQPADTAPKPSVSDVKFDPLENNDDD